MFQILLVRKQKDSNLRRFYSRHVSNVLLSTTQPYFLVHCRISWIRTTPTKIPFRIVGMVGVEPTCNLLLFLQRIRLRRYIPFVIYVHMERLELSLLSKPDPKSGVSTNFTTHALL